MSWVVAVRLVGRRDEHRGLVGLGVQLVEPAGSRFREDQRPVHQADRIVQAVEPFFDPFDRRAALDHSGDIERDADGGRRLTCLTPRDIAR